MSSQSSTVLPPGEQSRSEVTLRADSDEAAAYADAYPRVFRYIRTLVRDQAEAEDLTQETFLRAYRSREALREPQARLAWLYRIATHVCVDRMRERSRRPVEADTPVEELSLADGGPPLQQLVERGELSACVQTFLADLSDDYRAVMLLHELHELTAREIADQLGVSLETVKIRLHRARGKLRAALETGCTFSRDERDVLVCERGN
jgi:RNA polymerase sigma-70 factor (ECF subfamily)